MCTEHLWVSCDSRSELKQRLSELRGAKILPSIEAEDANTWGFIRCNNSKLLIIPIGYTDVGLLPVIIATKDLLLIGITELVAGIDLASGTIAFRYRMPTVFHEFVRVDESGVLLQDEIGFVLLSLSGEERWRFSKNLIQSYRLSGNELVVTTFEGEHFRVRVGGPGALTS